MQKIRTVFLGDSITEGYGVESNECWVSKQKGYICNHGISGDTTTGMLRRFVAHVLNETPNRTVIMGGLNDFLLGKSAQKVIQNLQNLYDFVRENGILLVPAICIRPDFDELLENGWIASQAQLLYLPERIAQTEDWIRSYCREHQCPYIDFAQKFPEYTRDGYCRYFLDGVHPNARGHEIMAEIAQEVLDRI